MTKAELLLQLQKVPDDAELFIYDDEYDYFNPLRRVASRSIEDIEDDGKRSLTILYWRGTS